MRTVAPQTLNHLQKNLGTEPILILGIEWVENSQEILYADQRVDGENYPYPTVIQVGGFDTALMISGSGDSQSISVTLDDIDGRLKWIFNNYDIHKRAVKVYHHFRGLHLDYKFLIFQGEINSPVIWNEGERTLSFTILTHTEDAEVAFAMEEGDFPVIPEDGLGKVWPLIFGQVCSMQAVKIQSPRKGYLISGEGWHDFTLQPRLCQARYIQCASISNGTVTTLESEPGGGYNTIENVEYGPDQTCVDNRFELICNLIYRLEQEMAYEHSVINIRDGGNFPQGEYITLNINGALLRGHFDGTYFHVEDREHPEYADWEHLACAPVEDHAYGVEQSNQNDQWVETESGTAWYHNQDPIETIEDCDIDSPIWRQVPVGGPSASWQAYEAMGSADFVWNPAGTEVFLEAEAEILHIVSLIPGTVDNVAAYKTMPNGRALLMEVPADYYTIYETDYDGYQVTEIGFQKKLSLYDAAWSDDIYVSFTSDVGPNPVDIIEWLLNKYTTLTYDAASFADVKAKMANYPCNFCVKERINILQLIHDIAYQTRCAIYIRSGVVYIKYLSEEPASVRTITEKDIVANSFLISLTETENITTKHVIDWQKTGAGVESGDKVDLKIVLKHNIPKYGTTEESYNYYSQNTYDTILKSATFWLIRHANTWKYVEFDTPLKHLDLDIFDCITLNVEQFSLTPTKVVIESAVYNPDSNTIHFKCWTPILAGTDAEYIWAWPAFQDAHLRFPLPEEEALAGAGYTFNVTPPVGHVLRSGYVDAGDGAVVILTSGDQNPSDLDDAAPTVVCDISDTYDLEEDDPAFEALTLARQNRDTLAEQAMSKDVPPAGSDVNRKKERKACGKPQKGDGCIYEVKVYYIWPDLVTSGHISGIACQGGPCRRGICGEPCTGAWSVFCHTFSAFFAATMFYMQKKTEIEALMASCGYCSQVTNYPYMVRAPRAIPDPDSPDDCEEMPGDPNAPNQGETYEPKETT